MRIPREYGKIVSLGVTLAAGILLMTAGLRSQQIPPVGPVWEFASVTSTISGGTSICYAVASGCRLERPSDSRGLEGMMAAAAKLGEKGWELAGSDMAGDNKQERVLYFKRLKSVLNRSDSPGAH